MDTSLKILTVTELLPKIHSLVSKGKRIVFTNGCFDLIHAGHVDYLNAAKKEGDILFVGLNSDKSVKKIKGIKRPVICEEQRAKVLSALQSVDFVSIFDEPDPLMLIYAVKPHILVKGADWDEKKIIGSEFVKKNGGKVVRITFNTDISTSRIIDTIIRRYSL